MKKKTIKNGKRIKAPDTKSQTLRDAYLTKNYGITLTDYLELFEKQQGCCYICSTHQLALPKTLAVDHCHRTNKVRGLLCSACNMGLGHLNDDIELLMKAARYLRGYPYKEELSLEELYPIYKKDVKN